MSTHILSKQALKDVLSVRDLTNPEEGPHALQWLIQEILEVLSDTWNVPVHIYRTSPVVSIADNYDALHYPEDGPARAAKYSRYLCDTALLRTSTSAMVPKALQELGDHLEGEDLIACPGLVYRRDCIDRLHLGEIHQMDLWRISQRQMEGQDLKEMIQRVLNTAVPGYRYRLEPRVHPYTLGGYQMDVKYEDKWIEVGECGVAHPAILAENLPHGENHQGLAMGLGLDRLLMIRKGISDIRLVASVQPEVAAQMLDLSRYHKVSSMPSVARDLSVVLPKEMEPEEIGDRVREALGSEAILVASIDVLDESQYEDLPERVQVKLGMNPQQKNVLLRIILQALDRTLSDVECNTFRNRIYRCLHQGENWEWAE